MREKTPGIGTNYKRRRKMGRKRKDNPEKKRKCIQCDEEVEEKDLDKGYKLPMCKKCSRDFAIYGTE